MDAVTGELRRQGVRIRLKAQPFQVLCMLLERPGELLTREEISRQLWPDGTFVDYEHGVNSAVNRIREALGDAASSPRFVETLARRGYRFVAQVEWIGLNDVASAGPLVPSAVLMEMRQTRPESRAITKSGFLATPEELPKTAYPIVQTLFVLLQIMYVAFYVGALANVGEIEELFSSLPHATVLLTVMIVTAGLLIPLRAFLISAVIFRAPGAQEKILRIWPFLLPFDELWALSPFLLLHHMSFGLALSCIALLVYSPFAQRALVLMGAGGSDAKVARANELEAG